MCILSLQDAGGDRGFNATAYSFFDDMGDADDALEGALEVGAAGTAPAAAAAVCACLPA